MADQQELFETADVPDVGPVVSDQRPLNENEVIENLESSSIEIEKTRSAFSTAQLDTSSHDYSGSVDHSKRTLLRKAGIVGDAIEFGILQRRDRRFESPLERYHRLNAEITAFMLDLQQIECETPGSAMNPPSSTSSNQNQKNQIYDNGVSTADIVIQVEQLQSMMSSIANRTSSPTFGIAPSQDGGDRLIKVLESATASKSNTAPVDSSNNSTANAITYELFYSDHNSNTEQQSLAAIDRRIASLERALGSPSNDSSLASGGLVHVIESLENKLALLDPTKLAVIQQQLVAINKEQANAIAPESSTDDAIDRRKQLKVNQLFDLALKWDTVATQLPNVVSRLHTLRDIHHQSAVFASELQRLNDEQAAITDLLSTNGEQLKQFESSFQRNIETINNNIQSLSSRLDNVHKMMSSSASTPSF